MESQLVCSRCKSNALEHPGKVVCVKNSVNGIEVPDTYYYLCDKCLGDIDNFIKDSDTTILNKSEFYAICEESKLLRHRSDAREKDLKEKDSEIAVLKSDIAFFRGKLEAYAEIFGSQKSTQGFSMR